VLVLLQARELQRAFKLRLTPVAGGFFVALQCRGQVAGLAVHFEADFEHLLDFRLQAGVPLQRLRVHLINTALEPVDLFTEGFQQVLQGRAAGGGKALALVIEDTVGQVLEFLAQVVARLIEHLQLLFVA
jgi:hypothetical protein